MRWLAAYIRLADRLNEAVGRAVSWLSAAMVVVVCLNVALRYVAGHSVLALQELSWHMFGLLFLLGAAYALKHGRHVRVDVVYGGRSPRTQAWIDLLGGLLLLLPFAVLGVGVSLDFVVNAFAVGETSPDPGGLPARWVLKAAIPVGFALLAIQGLAESGRALFVLRGQTPPDGRAQEQAWLA